MMALLMVMTICLLVYAALEYRLRQALYGQQGTFPDAAQDHFFQFQEWRDGTVLVQETTNATARRLARYEIRTFKAIVQQTYGSA